MSWLFRTMRAWPSRVLCAAVFLGGAFGGLTATSVAQATPTRPATSTQAGARYLLGPFDVITVNVYSHPEVSGDFLVPSDGRVAFPLVGEVAVSGMTLSDLNERLKKGLSKELLDPNVAVTLKAPRPRRVSITGDVMKPGSYDLSQGWKLVDLVSAAGGLPPTIRAEDTNITVLERNGTRETTTFAEATNGDDSKNFSLDEGDVITVDAGTMSVYVVGQVKAPGVQHLQRGNGVLEAIAGAGGTLPTAALNKARLVRLSGTEQSLDLVPDLVLGKPSPMPKLQQGDLIVIPESLDQFAVLGFVAAPGAYPYPQGHELTLSDAVAAARGHDISPTSRPRFSKVGIARVENGKPQHYVYDLGKFFAKGDVTQNPPIHPGDVIYVPESDQVAIRDILSAVSSFALLWRASR